MRFRLLLPILLMFATINITSAQDDTLAPWPVVERCLPTPITPDDDWSYEGEIMLRGWAGIHGIRAGFDNPYVAYFGGGILSPNGHWVLTQHEHTYSEQLTGSGPMGRFTTEYGSIDVENLTTKQKISFPWEATYTIFSSPYPFGPANPLWLDNSHFIAFYGLGGNETKMGDLETGEVIDLPHIDLDDYEYSVSPDQTRAISYGQLYDLSKQMFLKENVGTDHDLEWTAWAHDSSMFIDMIRNQNRSSANLIVYDLTVFDRNGNVIAVPIFSGEQNIWLGAFSPKDDYFSLIGYEWYGDKHHPFIMDLRKKVIYDLCIDNALGIVWSPDGSQFAFIAGEGQQPIVVVDMDDWQARIVGYHTGSVMKWRSLP